MHTYDPTELTVIFGGPLTGWVEDSFLTITPDDDDYMLVVGADGEGGRSKSANAAITVKMEVLQTSATNDVLSAIRALGNDGVLPLVIRDNLGRTLVNAAEAQGGVVGGAHIDHLELRRGLDDCHQTGRQRLFSSHDQRGNRRLFRVVA